MSERPATASDLKGGSRRVTTASDSKCAMREQHAQAVLGSVTP